MTDERPRAGLFVVLGVVLVLALAAFWLPRWWENREFREAEAIAGVGARMSSGTLAEARGKVESGLPAAKVTDALGKPSIAVRTQGASAYDIWTYYFTDGTLTINLTDGYVARVSTQFGPPLIPTSSRP